MKSEPGTSEPMKMERRDFLRVLGAGAAIAATAPLAATTAEADNATNDDKRKSLYRVTADVRNFYRVNRYPKT